MQKLNATDFRTLLRIISKATYSSDGKYVYYPFNDKIFGNVFLSLNGMGVTVFKDNLLNDVICHFPILHHFKIYVLANLF